MSDRKMGHVQSFKVYLVVFATLIVLTAVTVWAGQTDFGIWSSFVAVGIAGIKASLVTLFFMHAKYEGKATWAFILYPGVLLFILIGGLFLDYATRNNSGFRLQEPIINHGHVEAGHIEAGHGGDEAGHGHDEKSEKKSDDHSADH